MFKKFFDTSAINAFSDQVVAQLTRHMSPTDINRRSKAVDKQRERFESILERCVASLGTTPLNIYQKARLGTSLQARMEAAGYPQVFCQQLAHDTVRMVAIAASRRA